MKEKIWQIKTLTYWLSGSWRSEGKDNRLSFSTRRMCKFLTISRKQRQQIPSKSDFYGTEYQDSWKLSVLERDVTVGNGKICLKTFNGMDCKQIQLKRKKMENGERERCTYRKRNSSRKKGLSKLNNQETELVGFKKETRTYSTKKAI